MLASHTSCLHTMLVVQHTRRHQKLVGKSRSWIAPEDLEARIEAALEYPRKL